MIWLHRSALNDLCLHIQGVPEKEYPLLSSYLLLQFMFQHQIFTKQRGGLGEQVKITNLFKYVILVATATVSFYSRFSGFLSFLLFRC